MTSVSGIGSSSLLNSYLESTSNKDLDSKEIFKKLSIDVGNDGKEITKEQLDNYITKAEKAKSGKEDTSGISDEELSSLKDMQKNWDKIADGGDKITYSDMSSYQSTLKSMDEADKAPEVDVSKFVDTTPDVNAYIVESTLGNSVNSGAKSLLNTLLTGNTDTNDDSNADLIDKLTNLIASYKESTSTIETEA